MCSSCMHIDSSTNNDFSWQPICISVPWVRCSYQMKKKHMGRSDGRMVHYTWMSSHLKLHIGICMTSLTVFGRNPIDSINGLDSSYGIMAMDAQLNLGLVGTFTLQSKWVWWEHGYTWQAALKGMLCGSFLKPRTSITPPHICELSSDPHMRLNPTWHIWWWQQLEEEDEKVQTLMLRIHYFSVYKAPPVSLMDHDWYKFKMGRPTVM